jgi:ABC-type multidrug transport system fused ATPase/permease subunit
LLTVPEATSSIDAKTDAAIQHTIRAYFQDATVLTVAHRISTIIDYDMIIVMEKGEIIEMGEPGTLLDRQGAFWALASEAGAIAGNAAGASGS